MPQAKASIYQLKITLRDSKPPIWRRLLVVNTMTFAEFHNVMQLAMGWEGGHLHDFRVNQDTYIGDPSFDEGFGPPIRDERKIRLKSILKKAKQKITYTYDFGDNWEHEILLEKILPYSPETALPQCLKGKRACPPEDCGGIWGYDDFLAAISDPSHPEHEDMLDWIGGEFDPEAFDLDETNRLLREYCR